MANKTLKGLLTTKEVASYFEVEPRHVLRMIREGRLIAEKFGWQWVIRKEDLPEAWPPPAA